MEKSSLLKKVQKAFSENNMAILGKLRSCNQRMSKIDDLLDLKWNFVKEACKDLKCKGAYITEDEYNSL